MLNERESVRMSAGHPTPTEPIVSTRPSPVNSPIVRSALWAAWGDALGFPAEMANAELLDRRLGSDVDSDRPTWSRRIGGRMGPTVELPAGAYSDDTQLRLAVSRCIRTSGRFDVEAFSKIELPVFLSYELGAGRGTKTAAKALGRRATRWYSNFFDQKSSRYLDGGGNGAAMRIQPHVWAASEAKPRLYLRPLLQDAVCTHGHPRGIVGAALHGVALGSVLREGEVPSPERWPGMVRFLERLNTDVLDDETLRERWLPEWEKRSGRPWEEAVQATLGELQAQVQAATKAAKTSVKSSRAQVYRELALELGGTHADTRGAGTVSAVLALWLAWTYQANPIEGMRTGARLLGSDTDTIATMAGALLGPVAHEPPPIEVADAELISTEAIRLERMSRGERPSSFAHPDPLRWQPPGSLADAVGLIDGQIAIAGLGRAREDSELISGNGKDPALWQWLVTEYGQRLLIKRRTELKELPAHLQPRARSVPPLTPPDASPQPRLFELEAVSIDDRLPERVEDGVEMIAAADFAPELISRLFLHFAAQEDGVIRATAFGTLLATRVRDRDSESGTNARNGRLR